LAGLPFLLLSPPAITPLSVASILILGVFQLGIPYILYAIAVRRCSPLSCSLIGMIEPLFNPVWVFLVVGEAPGFFAFIGGIIVLATVTLWSISNAKQAV
jgi:drug/metabolite transporter (DMT)-like permease